VSATVLPGCVCDAFAWFSEAEEDCAEVAAGFVWLKEAGVPICRKITALQKIVLAGDIDLSCLTAVSGKRLHEQTQFLRAILCFYKGKTQVGARWTRCAASSRANRPRKA
jgi:hypothetical protein